MEDVRKANGFKAQQQSMIQNAAPAQENPYVSGMLQRARDQFASMGQFFRPNGPDQAAEQQPSTAEGMQWQIPPKSGLQTAPTGSDNYAAMGFADNVPRSLIGTESGGNWSAYNNETGSGGMRGHAGILQFGQARFGEAKASGAIPSDMTFEAFGSGTPESRAAQIAAANWHFADIDSRIKANGYDKYVGQNIGGVPITWDGMRSMAHLGGFGGMSSFLKSGGGYNPSDAYGTSLAAYGRTHQN